MAMKISIVIFLSSLYLGYNFSVIHKRLRRFESNCTKTGEEFVSCGTACPNTCENLGVPRPCPYMCFIGCACKAGLVRDARNPEQPCIKPSDCTNPPVCDRPNEEYQECVSVCRKHCFHVAQNLDPPCYIDECIPSCVCKEGYVRGSFEMAGECVKEEECLPSSS